MWTNSSEVTKVSKPQSCLKRKCKPHTRRRAFFVVVALSSFASRWKARSKHSSTCSFQFFSSLISVHDALHFTSRPSLYNNITVHHDLPSLYINTVLHHGPSNFPSSHHIYDIIPSTPLRNTSSTLSAIMADAIDG